MGPAGTVLMNAFNQSRLPRRTPDHVRPPGRAGQRWPSSTWTGRSALKAYRTEAQALGGTQGTWRSSSRRRTTSRRASTPLLTSGAPGEADLHRGAGEDDGRRDRPQHRPDAVRRAAWPIFKANVDSIAAAAKKGGANVDNWSTIQGTFNFKLAVGEDRGREHRHRHRHRAAARSDDPAQDRRHRIVEPIAEWTAKHKDADPDHRSARSRRSPRRSRSSHLAAEGVHGDRATRSAIVKKASPGARHHVARRPRPPRRRQAEEGCRGAGNRRRRKLGSVGRSRKPRRRVRPRSWVVAGAQDGRPGRGVGGAEHRQGRCRRRREHRRRRDHRCGVDRCERRHAARDRPGRRSPSARRCTGSSPTGRPSPKVFDDVVTITGSSRTGRLCSAILIGPISALAVLLGDLTHWKTSQGLRRRITWIEVHWSLVSAILTGPIGLAVLFIVKHWSASSPGPSDGRRRDRLVRAAPAEICTPWATAGAAARTRREHHQGPDRTGSRRCRVGRQRYGSIVSVSGLPAVLPGQDSGPLSGNGSPDIRRPVHRADARARASTRARARSRPQPGGWPPRRRPAATAPSTSPAPAAAAPDRADAARRRRGGAAGGTAAHHRPARLPGDDRPGHGPARREDRQAVAKRILPQAGSSSRSDN